MLATQWISMHMSSNVKPGMICIQCVPNLHAVDLSNIHQSTSYNDETNGQCVGVTGGSWWIERDGKTGKHTHTHTHTHQRTHIREETRRTETTQAYILSLVGILCAPIFVKHECICYLKIWLTTSLLATQGIWCLRLWAHQNKILSVVQVYTKKCYSCNPMDFHGYVKKCKAWHDLFLMCPQLTCCWFVKYPSIDIVQW